MAATIVGRGAPISFEVDDLMFQGFECGPDEGELVVFLHGFPQFADAFLPVMVSAAAAGFHCLAVDQRGYSPEARPLDVEAYAIEHLVGDVLSFADSEGHDRFHLVGHDWGGIVAWHVAARHRNRLRSLTVLSTPHPDALFEAIKSDPDQTARSQYVFFLRQPADVPENIMMANGAERLRSVYRGSLSEQEVERNVRRFSEPGAYQAAVNWYRALDLDTRIGPVDVPTLYIWGSADHALGETAAVATVRLVDGDYEFVRLEGKTHWLLEEAAEDIASLLVPHLLAHRSGTDQAEISAPDTPS